MVRLASRAASSPSPRFFTRLTAWLPHEDETLALFVARQPLGRLLDIVLEERGGAPLHHLLAAIASHSGGGPTALRLGSALFGEPATDRDPRRPARLVHRAVALTTTVLVSASWVLLFHGVYGRMYSLFLFTSALSYSFALLWATTAAACGVLGCGASRRSPASRAIRTARWCSRRRACTSCSCVAAFAR